MIEIIEIKPRDEKRQIAFFTINGQEFSCGNVPIELDTTAKVLTYLKGRESEFKLLMENQELKYKFPKEIGLKAKIDASSLSKELKDLLKEIIKL